MKTLGSLIVVAALTWAGLALADEKPGEPVRGERAPESRARPETPERGRPAPPAEGRGENRGRPDHPEEIERRVRHLHAAAENLEQAGFPDEARAYHERAEHLARESRREAPPRGAGGPGEQIEHLRREVAELREIVEDLRRQVRAGNHPPRPGGPERD